MTKKTAASLAGFLTVCACGTLDLIFPLNRVRVAGLLRAVGLLISQALGDGLDGTERSEASASADQVDGGVNTTERGDIDGLTTDGTGRTDLTGVLTRATVLHGIEENLDGVLVGVEEVDDLQSLLDDADGLQLLTVVATVHHHGAREALNDGAQSLTEATDLVATSRVGNEDLSLCVGALDVIDQGDLGTDEVVHVPLAEQLRLDRIGEVGHFGVVLL